MGARAELVMAFGRPQDARTNYAAIQHAFAMGDSLKNNPTLLNQISQTIEMFEDAALERVRQYLENQAEELVSDPSDSARPTLNQPKDSCNSISGVRGGTPIGGDNCATPGSRYNPLNK